MAITTWLTDEEKRDYIEVDDKELNELFQEVRAVTKKFLIHQSIGESRKKVLGFIPWGWNVIVYYTLYIDIGHEAQVFNFAPPEGSSSICTGVTKDALMNFFFGVLAGNKFNKPDDANN